ncbi:MAG: porin [Deltaproteobacteria bacterium]|nr:porin [Deltaproteobacteria bacterium]
MIHLRWPVLGLALTGIIQISAAAAAETPVVTAGSKGFVLTSPDKAFELKLRGYLQADGRFVADDDNKTFNNTFLLRRVRPLFEGTLYSIYGFRVMPDFGGGSTVLQDAYIEANFLPELKFRAGKFKGPVGLERLQSGTDIRFVERGLPTNLVPNRDVGVQVSGDLFDNTLSYAIGGFNGAPDGGNSDVDVSDDKEFEGRVFATPLRNHFGPFQNLGFGFGATYGDTKTSSDLGKFKTQAQQTFFSYRSSSTPTPVNTAVAHGLRYRLAPQANWYYKQFGLLGEYVRSSQEVRIDTTQRTLDHDAWQILGSWIVTGEENSYKGVTPSAPFDISQGTWGAWELVGRYGELDVDDSAFPVFADPEKSATAAQSWGVGVNWYLNKNVRLEADYEQTTFDGGGKSGADRDDEQAFFTRLQLAW